MARRLDTSACFSLFAHYDPARKTAAGPGRRLRHSRPFVKAFRYALDPLCLLGSVLYALNRWGLKPRVHSEFLHGQFNDLLLIPCALPIVLWLQRRLGLRHHDDVPTAEEIIFHLIVWSILFEIIGPHLVRVTGDPLDVLVYVAGGLAAGLWWHQTARQQPVFR